MSNDQIHNNLYLTVENSIEIGKVYQVIEKWVFFKLFQILQTDSSGGKNHKNDKSHISFKKALTSWDDNMHLKVQKMNGIYGPCNWLGVLWTGS